MDPCEAISSKWHEQTACVAVISVAFLSVYLSHLWATFKLFRIWSMDVQFFFVEHQLYYEW